MKIKIKLVLGSLAFTIALPCVNAATFTVTNSANSGSGTLRSAITNANAAGAGTHTIAFNLAPPHQIILTNALPSITNSIFINGATQPGYTGMPLVQLRGNYGTIEPGLNFLSSGGGAHALRITGITNNSAISLNGASNRLTGCWIMTNIAGVVVNSLGRYALIGGVGATNRNVISANQTAAIQLVGHEGNNTVQGNYIGLDASGVASMTGQLFGITISSPSNRIGGTTAGERNVISGFSNYGVTITGTNATANIVQGNYIGINATGNGMTVNEIGIRIEQSIGNTIGGVGIESRNFIGNSRKSGIEITGDRAFHNNIINNSIGIGPLTNAIPNGVAIPNGGILLNAGSNSILFNVVSGNIGNGVGIMPGNRGNVLAGNIIGLDPSGTQLFPNSISGVAITEASSNTIGSALFPNIISGNGQSGIRIIGPGAEGNVLVNNRIGTDITGTLPRGNSGNGIVLDHARQTIIGTTNAGNVISANGDNGVFIIGSQSDSSAIHFNLIGLDAPGTNSLGNTAMGILISGSGGHRIGSNGRNYISGNGSYGISMIGSECSNSVVHGNYIGVGTNGAKAIPNMNGISMQNISGPGVVVSNNIISGNISNGIELQFVNSALLVAGNIIGLSASASTIVSNGGSGITIFGSDGVRIGGNSASERNTIAGYGSDGVMVIHSGSNAPVVIAGNYIGLSSSGATLPGWQGRFGVSIVNSRNIQIGGPSTLWRNVIGGNQNGLRLTRSMNGNISYNYIGTDPSAISARANSIGIVVYDRSVSNLFENNIVAGNSGAGFEINDGSAWNTLRANRIGFGSIAALPNNGIGVHLIDAHDTLVGGYAPADGNRIAFNAGSGVVLGYFTNTIRNMILANLIYSNAIPDIDLGGDGITLNDPPPDADTGPNGLQNKPQLFFASMGATNISGMMSGRSGTLRIEFMARTPAGDGIFIGATNLYVPPDGVTPFSFALPPAGIPSGSLIYSTATSEEGTSEFSEGVMVAVPVDTDGDLMPDWWEIAYGLNPSVSNAPNSDADGDGISDLHEWIADTNPSDSNSYLQFIDTAADSGFIAYIPSSGLRRYNFSAASMSSTQSWTNVLTNVTGTGGLLALPDTTGHTQRIYRVEARLP